MKSQLSGAKMWNLMIITSAAVFFHVLDYAQACILFKSMQTGDKVWTQARLKENKLRTWFGCLYFHIYIATSCEYLSSACVLLINVM